MVQLKFLTISLILLVSSGCSILVGQDPEKQVVLQTEYVEKFIPIQKRPDAIVPRDVTFKVVTSENLEQFMEYISTTTGAIVFYAMTVNDYERLSMNVADVKRYLLQQNELLIYYENAVAPKIEGDENSK
jgi:hypothetical protein|tara:strand:+ start:43 stop:432 length:390 start_codon:yes stop_codon:yes gene_type:complete